MSQQACPSPTTVVYVVTGASRGIGLGLVEALAARPNTLVYATARHASKADALQQLAQQHTSLRVLQLDVQSDDEHAAVVQLVEAEAGRVDVVIANAGLNVPESFGTTDTVPLALMQQHYEVNTIAPLRLFQRLFRLLSRSDDPKFIVLSSTVGSIGSQAHAEFASMQLAVYGSSKAAVNYLVMRVHTEHTHITAFPCSPGTNTLGSISTAAATDVWLRTALLWLGCVV